MKKIGLLVLLSLLLILVSACSGTSVVEAPSVCRQYEGSSDFDVCLRDPQAYEFKEQMDQASALATRQAEETKVSPPPQHSEEVEETILTTDLIYCAAVKAESVEAGDGIGKIAENANNNQFPPYDFAGIGMMVGHYKSGQLQGIFNLQMLMTGETSSPILNVGDEVCVSTNRQLLEDH